MILTTKIRQNEDTFIYIPDTQNTFLRHGLS